MAGEFQWWGLGLWQGGVGLDPCLVFPGECFAERGGVHAVVFGEDFYEAAAVNGRRDSGIVAGLKFPEDMRADVGFLGKLFNREALCLAQFYKFSA